MTNLTLPVQLDPASPPNETLHVTVGGWAARIYATDGGDAKPIHGAIFIGGEWLPRTWTSGGFFHNPSAPSPFDLRDRAPVKRGVWVAWFADDEGNNFLRSYATQAEAETAEHKWATLRGVTYLAEGDGLSTPADPPLVVDWAKLPEWANWAAADENGRACYYDVKPDICAGGSLHGRFWHPRQSNWRRGLLAEGQYRLAPGFDWRKTLTQRPEVQND